METLSLRKASRQRTKIRLGISGPSGSGKTYSALLMASGMARWEKIALVDTENGSGDLYAHLGPYNVITLTAPFSPERYIQAIQACEKEGIEVIVIDSIAHEWDGKGGCLESNDLVAQTRFKGNTWSAWSVTTPRHQKFIDAIVSSKCHIITTARSKTETIQTDDKKVKKVGMKEVQREGFEYELTLNFTLDRDTHFATASKDRTGLFEGFDPFLPSPETGKQILEWTLLGEEPKQSDFVSPDGTDVVRDPPQAPAAPAKKKPTVTKVMETITACSAEKAAETVYQQAGTYQWTPQEWDQIAACFDSTIAKIKNAKPVPAAV